MGHAQRVAKLCKYLSLETHWIPHVICGRLPYDILPGQDQVLADEIPQIVKVKRVPSFIASDFAATLRRWRIYKPVAVLRKLTVLPDAYGDWINRAVEAAEKEYPGGKGIACILASGPPNSVYIAGLRLAQRWKLPLIIDMRDPWERPAITWPTLTPWHRTRLRFMEKAVYKGADVIIANTEGNAADLKRRYPELENKIRVIPNGFDPEDLDPERGPRLREPGEPEDTIHFLYLGGIRGAIRGRAFEGDFLQAVADYLSAHPDERPKIKIHFVGGTAAELESILGPYGLTDISRAYGVVASNDVGRPLYEADIYVLILPDLGPDQGWIPAKLYYYLAGGKYIFALIPNGSAKDLLLSVHAPAEYASPRNRQEAVKALGRIINRARLNPRIATFNELPAYALRFDRREIARQVGAVMDEVSSRGTK